MANKGKATAATPAALVINIVMPNDMFGTLHPAFAPAPGPLHPFPTS